MISETQNLDLAVFLTATGRLRFVGLAPNGGGKLKFRFEGNAGQLSDFENEFASGAEAPAIAVLSTYRAIRQAMQQFRSRGQV